MLSISIIFPFLTAIDFATSLLLLAVYILELITIKSALLLVQPKFKISSKIKM